jgi:hypothetical protein
MRLAFFIILIVSSLAGEYSLIHYPQYSLGLADRIVLITGWMIIGAEIGVWARKQLEELEIRHEIAQNRFKDR